jgi:hypothetical protein
MPLNMSLKPETVIRPSWACDWNPERVVLAKPAAISRFMGDFPHRTEVNGSCRRSADTQRRCARGVTQLARSTRTETYEPYAGAASCRTRVRRRDYRFRTGGETDR